VTATRDGTLYFSSDRDGGEGGLDLYRAPRVAGRYPAAYNLGPPVNTGDGDDLPFIAPDESYLIFASDRPGGLGNRDLYVSFRVDGRWTAPRNLGSPINSPAWDIYPSVSPDGRYLFFTRRQGWEPDDDSDIFWVSAAFLPRLRAEFE
jgi:Tol biopolymer transport system component